MGLTPQRYRNIWIRELKAGECVVATRLETSEGKRPAKNGLKHRNKRTG